LNEDLFLQKPISNKDLVREIENKINGSRIKTEDIKRKENSCFCHILANVFCDEYLPSSSNYFTIPTLPKIKSRVPLPDFLSHLRQ
jgi:hypothetical protein